MYYRVPSAMNDVYICHSTPQKVNDISMTAKEFVRNFLHILQAAMDYCETIGDQIFLCPEGFRAIVVPQNVDVSASPVSYSTNEETGKLTIRL